MRLLILGGTGPLGMALIPHLRARHAGVHITVISRTFAELPGASRVIKGDQAQIVPSPEFARELADCDAVVHLGDGLGMLQRGGGAVLAENADRLVAASERMAEAAGRAGVTLFIYVSSIKALCDENDDRVLTEGSDPRCTTLYGRSKLRLERRISDVLDRLGTRLVVIRNPATYGAGSGGSIHRLVRLAATPLPLPFDGLANRRSLLATRNFASALEAVVRTGRHAPSGIFHVHDGPPLSTTRIVEVARAAQGRSRRLFSVGPAVTSLAQHVPVLGPLSRRLYGSLELSDALFRSSFAWVPETTSEAALAELACEASRSPDRLN